MSAEAASERIVLRRGGGGFGTRGNGGSAPAGRLMAFFTGPYRLVRWFWRRWWGKLLVLLLASPFILYFLLWLLFARGLPSAESLLHYQPELPSYVRDANGNPAQVFARERRVQLAYDEFPAPLINAFLAAEDRTFFSHGGIDYPGLAGAVLDYVSKSGSGDRARGGSTITQQVAKIFFVGDEYSVTRKIREAFLARRIEATLTKQQILELYMNQIFLGRNAYGVQAAARAYFNKDVGQLTLAECAFLAALPKSPSNYDPVRHHDAALQRRNFVLSEMLRNSFINQAQYEEAVATPLETARGGSPDSVRNVGGYFMEEVRRQLIARYGEEAVSGPNSVYAGGLWVRSSYDPRMQEAAETALRDGLRRYESGMGWRDPGLSIPLDGWRQRLASAALGPGYPTWRAAVVLAKQGGEAELGFTDGSRGTLPASLAAMPKRGTATAAFNALRPGAVIAVERQGESGDVYALRSIPEVSGGFVAEEVQSGRILAMQGGWDVRGGGGFNRATQALRQPGSTFKPIVYAAALDAGMTPASIIVDGPFCANNKCFRNFSGGYAGPQTMRWGLEQSRNLMTVRTANQIGMANVIRRAQEMGVGDYSSTPYLPISLGAGDTTVQRMVNAFAIFANQGRALTPTVIDYIQDRNGRTIWRADTRPCDGCNAPDWNGRPMPRPPLRTRQVVDAMTAYQVVHMLEGVIQRGTATILRDLNRPIFGKTGTTSGPTNVWFIGGSQQVVAGVYLGFDRQARSLGGYAQGGTIAAPIFRQFARTAFDGMPVIPFRAPTGIRMVRIDRRSGQRVYGAWPPMDPRAGIIWEAFKPESEPRRTVAREVVDANARRAAPTENATQNQSRGDSDFLQREGGIY
ncbi:MAG TPA: PBP1A family penicillin-binding protein [Allosphingosinicella sp.]|nr:PBP1A family penicillin-binding protein [Allosphingosinicella sp.]